MTSLKTLLNLLLFLFLFFQYCSATDTISPNQLVKDGNVVVSIDGIFALGFFSPGNSKNRYIGIWYNKIQEQTVVWVANRDNPVKRSTGILKFDQYGNLALFDQSDILWSTNVSFLANNSIAKLSDSGNLVITDVKSKRAVWQSFDYPTNTFLSGMKLGLNLKTGLNRFLTSWKSLDDPARGDYTFELDPRGSPEFFLRKGLTRRWRSGPWDGRALNGVPEMTRSFIFNYNFTDNDDEIFMTYTIYNTSIFSRFLLDELGSVQRSTWLDGPRRWNTFWSGPRDKCDHYGECGAYGSCNSNTALECSCLPGFTPKSPRDWYLRDGSHGCERKRDFFCGNGDGFLMFGHVKV
ncbi:hypothetical protein GIB67_016388 [Kingdonia uniflora]|uniref:Bulb-type lectin domain-containing protein n=1 Tax=Kingdonia uniflora TaxID=39325 RepID=A0A7J7MGY1_9MAGN|nr:hypothetical protein GIB67_016388 [Kingdonia uniflora]